jgi:tetratricopeptide (TPR) repeat protein
MKGNKRGRPSDTGNPLEKAVKCANCSSLLTFPSELALGAAATLLLCPDCGAAGTFEAVADESEAHGAPDAAAQWQAVLGAIEGTAMGDEDLFEASARLAQDDEDAPFPEDFGDDEFGFDAALEVGANGQAHGSAANDPDEPFSMSDANEDDELGAAWLDGEDFAQDDDWALLGDEGPAAEEEPQEAAPLDASEDVAPAADAQSADEAEAGSEAEESAAAGELEQLEVDQDGEVASQDSVGAQAEPGAEAEEGSIEPAVEMHEAAENADSEQLDESESDGKTEADPVELDELERSDDGADAGSERVDEVRAVADEAGEADSMEQRAEVSDSDSDAGLDAGSEPPDAADAAADEDAEADPDEHSVEFEDADFDVVLDAESERPDAVHADGEEEAEADTVEPSGEMDGAGGDEIAVDFDEEADAAGGGEAPLQPADEVALDVEADPDSEEQKAPLAELRGFMAGVMNKARTLTAKVETLITHARPGAAEDDESGEDVAADSAATGAESTSHEKLDTAGPGAEAEHGELSEEATEETAEGEAGSTASRSVVGQAKKLLAEMKLPRLEPRKAKTKPKKRKVVASDAPAAELAAKEEEKRSHNRLGDQLLHEGQAESAIAHFARQARHYERIGSLRHAVAMYKKCLRTDPSLLQFHEPLGDLYSRRSLKGEALLHYELAAKCYLNTEDEESLRRVYEKVLVIAPRKLEARLSLAALLLAAGEKVEAIEQHRLVASTLIHREMYEEAVIVLERALDIDADSLSALHEMARALEPLGRLPELVDRLESDPARADCEETQLLLAQVENTIGRHEAAAERLTESLQRWPRADGIRRALYETAIKQRDPDSALAAYRPLIDQAIAEGRLSQAEGDLNAILRVSWRHSETLQCLLSLHERAGSSQHVRTELMAKLVDAYLNAEDYEQAELTLRELAACEPQAEQHQESLDFVRSKLNLPTMSEATALRECGLLDDAIGKLEDLVEHDDADVRVRALLTDILEEAGRTDEAVDHCTAIAMILSGRGDVAGEEIANARIRTLLGQGEGVAVDGDGEFAQAPVEASGQAGGFALLGGEDPEDEALLPSLDEPDEPSEQLDFGLEEEPAVETIADFEPDEASGSSAAEDELEVDSAWVADEPSLETGDDGPQIELEEAPDLAEEVAQEPGVSEAAADGRGRFIAIAELLDNVGDEGPWSLVAPELDLDRVSEALESLLAGLPVGPILVARSAAPSEHSSDSSPREWGQVVSGQADCGALLAAFSETPFRAPGASAGRCAWINVTHESSARGRKSSPGVVRHRLHWSEHEEGLNWLDDAARRSDGLKSIDPETGWMRLSELWSLVRRSEDGDAVLRGAGLDPTMLSKSSPAVVRCERLLERLRKLHGEQSVAVRFVEPDASLDDFQQLQDAAGHASPEDEASTAAGLFLAGMRGSWPEVEETVDRLCEEPSLLRPSQALTVLARCAAASLGAKPLDADRLDVADLARFASGEHNRLIERMRDLVEGEDGARGAFLEAVNGISVLARSRLNGAASLIPMCSMAVALAWDTARRQREDAAGSEPTDEDGHVASFLFWTTALNSRGHGRGRFARETFRLAWQAGEEGRAFPADEAAFTDHCYGYASLKKQLPETDPAAVLDVESALKAPRTCGERALKLMSKMPELFLSVAQGLEDMSVNWEELLSRDIVRKSTGKGRKMAAKQLIAWCESIGNMAAIDPAAARALRDRDLSVRLDASAAGSWVPREEGLAGLALTDADAQRLLAVEALVKATDFTEALAEMRTLVAERAGRIWYDVQMSVGLLPMLRGGPRVSADNSGEGLLPFVRPSS